MSHQLGRGYRGWQRARARGVPLAEALATPLAWDRRQVVIGAGAFGLVGGCAEPMIAPPPTPGGLASRARVAIVGAGLAGLTCCHRLAQAGIAAQVYEATDRVGGRVYTQPNAFGDGALIERGAELVNSTDEELLALADELGIGRIDLSTDYVGPDALSTAWWVGGRRYAPSEVQDRLAEIYAAIEPMVRALPPWSTLTWDTASDEARAYDQIPIPAFLRDAGVSDEAIALLSTEFQSEFGYPTDDMSALVLLQGLEAGDDIVWDERYKLVGGNSGVTDGLAARYDDRIHRGRFLRALIAEGGRYRLVFDGDRAEEVVADVVVLAIPFSVLRTVDLRLPLSPPKADAIARLTYGTNAKLFYRFTAPFWRDEGLDGYVLTDLPSQTVWDGAQGEGVAAGILVNYASGDHGIALGAADLGATADQLLADLAHLFPDIDGYDAGDAPIVHHWPSVPTALGAYAGYGLDQWTRFRGAEAAPEGGVFFAGEHTSLVDQGYMNGAADSGARAAVEVLSRLTGTAARRWWRRGAG